MNRKIVAEAQLEYERKKRQEKEAGGFWAVRRRRLRRFFLRVWRKLKSIKPCRIMILFEFESLLLRQQKRTP